MFGELYQYLVLHKKLNIPGIGTFSSERISADIDFASKQITAPSNTIVLHKDHNAVPSKKLFSWLAATLNVSELDAVIKFNNFVFDLRNKLAGGNKLHWDRLGMLSKGLSGDIIFEPDNSSSVKIAAVPAVKVLREKADHSVTVGEYERTADEMRELLAHNSRKKYYWWITVLIIGSISIAFIAYYFSSHGFTISSIGNQQKIVVKEN